jgi:hypothetical protein
MSDTTGHDAGHDPLRQEEDKIESGTIVAVGVIALAIFGVGIFWAVSIQKDSTGSVRSYTPEQLLGGKRDEVGMVYQSSFENDFAAKLKVEQSDYLNEIGWVDPVAKKVHIPIDIAMKEYLAESEKAGGKL